MNDNIIDTGKSKILSWERSKNKLIKKTQNCVNKTEIFLYFLWKLELYRAL